MTIGEAAVKRYLIGLYPYRKPTPSRPGFWWRHPAAGIGATSYRLPDMLPSAGDSEAATPPVAALYELGGGL